MNKISYAGLLFPRAASRADVPAHPFGDCREGQIPRQLAAGYLTVKRKFLLMKMILLKRKN